MTQTTVQTDKKKRQRFAYISEIIAELKKVTWLSRKDAIYLTGLVLLVAAVVGLILGAIDSLFSYLIELIFTGS